MSGEQDPRPPALTPEEKRAIEKAAGKGDTRPRGGTHEITDRKRT